ncbi:hypothetical protein CF319_g9126 [Tilletia indica]|nr:hypothetical protein CF319_g9126 [Tilletia indica]KAE8227691.1 hypothetical protein CF326_g7406 [Tilletia indica]
MPGFDFTYVQEAAVDRVRHADGDPYIILDIPRGTTDPDKLKQARRKAALDLHPDKNRHPWAGEAMKAVNQAFDDLSEAQEGRSWSPEPDKDETSPPPGSPEPDSDFSDGWRRDEAFPEDDAPPPGSPDSEPDPASQRKQQEGQRSGHQQQRTEPDGANVAPWDAGYYLQPRPQLWSLWEACQQFWRDEQGGKRRTQRMRRGRK